VTQGVDQYGLAATTRARLYGMDYIPSPVDAGPSFTTDLTKAGVGPKNTARWTLRIAPAVLSDGSFEGGDPAGDVLLRIRTRIASGFAIGDDTWKSSGTTWPLNDPDNLSMTYTWWADSAEDVPFTERAQFNGDPRHLPYKDCFNSGDDYPNSYNWYLDSLVNTNNAAADFPSISAGLLRNRWGAAMSCDVPRYFELLRNALVRSACVYTTLTGWSYYYMGVGNDIGYDSANGYPNSIPSNLVPQGSTGSGFINTIIGARRYVRANGANYWWGMPWLGELYPDSEFATWTGGTTPRGNLGAGNTAGNFYQQTCQSVYSGSNRLAYGTTMANNLQRTSTYGCTTLFNIGTNTSTFNHLGASGNGNLTTVGLELANNYNMTMPTAAPITRPFRINMSTGVAEHWNYAPYTTRYTASIYRTYYSHASGTGSGLVKLVNDTNTSAGYIVVNGISNAVDNGTTFISKFAVLSLVHSFFEAGSTDEHAAHPAAAAPRDRVTDRHHRAERSEHDRHPVSRRLDALGRARLRAVRHVHRGRVVAAVRDHLLAGQRRHLALRAGRLPGDAGGATGGQPLHRGRRDDRHGGLRLGRARGRVPGGQLPAAHRLLPAGCPGALRVPPDQDLHPTVRGVR
jgi:hypothetical protein